MSATDPGIELIKDAEQVMLASRIESYYQTETGLKLRMAYDWEYNIRMREGDQHYDFSHGFDRSTGQVPLSTYRKFTNDIPRPVTNYMRSVGRTLVANLTKSRPQGTVNPNSTNPKDWWGARIADLLLDDMHEELHEEEKRLEAGQWAWLTGSVFHKTFADASYERAKKEPLRRMVKEKVMHDVEVCQECSLSRAKPLEQESEGVCPECFNELKVVVQQKVDNAGKPIYTSKWEDVLDDHGNQKHKEVQPQPQVNTKVVSPFNISIDPAASSIDDARWVMESSIVSIAWVKENFSHKGDGYTGLASQVQPENVLNPILAIKERLKTILSSSGFYSTGSNYQLDLKNACVLKEYYERPTKDHPNGRMVVVVGGKALYVGDSLYMLSDGSWHPYNMFRWEILPGRFWGSTTADEAAKIQRRLNAIDSIMILIRQTTGSPQWLVPFGSRVPNGVFSGRPNLIINYSPVGANGARPERLPPAPWPEQIMAERQMCIQDMRDVTGTASVLEGVRPTGVSAVGSMNLLLEQATGAHASTIIGWEKFWERIARKKLLLFQKLYRKPQQDVVNRLRALNRDIPDDMITEFVGSDLRDNANVRIEPMSTAPRLHAAKIANLTDQLRYGAIDVANPINRQRYLNMVGLGDFDEQYTVDMKRAEWESEQLDHLDERVETVKWDDHAVHMKVHSDRTKRPDFWKQPKEVRVAHYQHIEGHEQWQLKLSIEQAQKQMMVSMAQMPPQQAQSVAGGEQGGPVPGGQEPLAEDGEAPSPEAVPSEIPQG